MIVYGFIGDGLIERLIEIGDGLIERLINDW